MLAAHGGRAVDERAADALIKESGYKQPVKEHMCEKQEFKDDNVYQSGVGHGKKDDVSNKSRAPTKIASSSSGGLGATPRVKQRILKKRDSAGSECRKCLADDFKATDDEPDGREKMEQEELFTEAQMQVENTPIWMIMLQKMMGVQADEVLGAVHMTTARLESLEVMLDKAHIENRNKFGHLEKNIDESEEKTKVQIATIEDRLQKLEFCGGQRVKGVAQPRGWKAMHVFLGGWPDCRLHRAEADHPGRRRHDLQAPRGGQDEVLRPVLLKDVWADLQGQSAAGSDRHGQLLHPAVLEEGRRRRRDRRNKDDADDDCRTSQRAVRTSSPCSTATTTPLSNYYLITIRGARRRSSSRRRASGGRSRRGPRQHWHGSTSSALWANERAPPPTEGTEAREAGARF